MKENEHVHIPVLPDKASGYVLSHWYVRFGLKSQVKNE